MTHYQRDGDTALRLDQPFHAYDASSVVSYARANLFTDSTAYTQNQMWALMLGSRGYPTHDVLIARNVHPEILALAAVVYRAAVGLDASRVIVVHTHPTGDPEPSYVETLLTDTFRTAGMILELPLVDHIVVTCDAWYSMRQNDWGQSQARP